MLIKSKSTVDTNIVNDVITSSISGIGDSKLRRAMALFTYLSFRSNRNIHAAVMETLANEIRPVLEVKNHRSLEVLSKKKCADAVVALMNNVSHSSSYYSYLNNYLYSFLPKDYINEQEPEKIFTFFIKTWEELGL